MKLTRPKKVMDIARPPIVGMAAAPAVDRSDSIMKAVELMLKHDLKLIAVMGNGRLIAHLRLTEALQYMGLQPTKQDSQDPRPDRATRRNRFRRKLKE